LASFAQPGSNDPTFNVLDDGSMSNGRGPNDVVRTSSMQSDGKVIIGGDFLFYNETLSSRIARVLENGWVDTTFNSGAGFDASVRSVKLSADGKILVGGMFTMFDGATINQKLPNAHPSHQLMSSFFLTLFRSYMFKSHINSFNCVNLLN